MQRKAWKLDKQARLGDRLSAHDVILGSLAYGAVSLALSGCPAGRRDLNLNIVEPLIVLRLSVQRVFAARCEAWRVEHSFSDALNMSLGFLFVWRRNQGGLKRLDDLELSLLLQVLICAVVATDVVDAAGLNHAAINTSLLGRVSLLDG